MGPLTGFRIIELAGIGPAPFCGMMLADMGAEVVRIDRTIASDSGLNTNPKIEVLNRGKKSVAVDLKCKEGVSLVLQLVAKADALIEGFRPGVTERLGLGPQECLAINEKLVYGRVTGWGQDGPMAQTAGHDINYIALAGILNAIGRKGEKPVPPLNLVGDFGGGGMLLAFGVTTGLLQAGRSGKGQVVDAAMTDGALSLMAGMFSMRAEGRWSDERGTNILDTGAPFYDVYETRDGKYMAVGSIEARFFKELVSRLGLTTSEFPSQWEETRWNEMREQLSTRFAERTQEDWVGVFEGSDACVAPVLTLSEAQKHPHFVERKAFLPTADHAQPAPAPRFSKTPASISSPPPLPGVHTCSVLKEWGISKNQIEEMMRTGVITETKAQKDE